MVKSNRASEHLVGGCPLRQLPKLTSTVSTFVDTHELFGSLLKTYPRSCLSNEPYGPRCSYECLGLMGISHESAWMLQGIYRYRPREKC